MTVPAERTRALIHTYELLRRLQDPKDTPRVPRWLRDHARALLRHYPDYAAIRMAHKALPHLYGPVPPLNRPSGSADALDVNVAAGTGENDGAEPKPFGPKAPKSGV